MERTRRLSPPAQTVLSHLANAPAEDWSYGYAIARHTQIKSGTLYPILARLAERGLLESTWEDQQAPGTPRRHLYRLTSAGVQAAIATEQPRRRATAGRLVPMPKEA
jgi:DNA-binding PadR family transcriptional regulator